VFFGITVLDVVTVVALFLGITVFVGVIVDVETAVFFGYTTVPFITLEEVSVLTDPV
jgi:Na+-translocating ferredoxin:NAD+ oxidoreductase RnfA subunit